MIDEAGAAPAAAEPIAAPAPEAEPQAPSPAERSKEPARASIDRAFAELDKQEKAAPAAKPEKTKEQPVVANDGRERDESGRFKPKEATAEPAAAIESQPEVKPPVETKPAIPAADPPSRFSADAKAAWKDAPAPVQAEINRAIKELEGGLKEYQSAVEPLKRHFALAKQNNTTVHDALDGYLNVERALRGQDTGQKLTALEGIFETAGISPRDYAAHIMGQKPDEAQSRSDQTIMQLRREIDGLKQQMGGVSQSIQERQNKEVEATVAEFARNNPRLNDHDFANTVSKLLQSGMTGDLKAAYDMAEKLNPSPVVEQPPAAPAAQTKPASDQTRKANLSIGGAPTGGSNPAQRKTPQSARDALNNAFASLGIG